MKHLFTSLAALLVTLAASAQTICKTYDIKGHIGSINSRRGIEVEYTPSRNVSVKAYIDKKYADQLKINLSRGVLNIDFSGNTGFNDNGKIKVVLTAPAIAGYYASQGSEIEVKGKLSVSGTMKIKTTSGSSVEFSHPVSATSVTANCSQGSELEFEKSLNCTTLDANISQGSSFEADNANVSRANINVSGGSSAEIDGIATEVNFIASGASSISASKLKATTGSTRASGASKIKCNVTRLKSSTSGVSSVKNKK
ncbi:MAG: DUF2807 domain-containing protein [Duncaniella sp.]|nr:DUF2807 domain-containing protein [Duncaniella sp.]